MRLVGVPDGGAAPTSGDAAYGCGARVHRSPTPDPIVVAVARATRRARKPTNRLAAFATAAPRERRRASGTRRSSFASTSTPSRDKLRAAYKPESKRGHKRYRGEVAAYRLGTLSAFRTCRPRRMRIFQARRAPRVRRTTRCPRRRALRRRSRSIDEGRVYGALMPWIDKLEFAPLESPRRRRAGRRSSRTAASLPADRLRAWPRRSRRSSSSTRSRATGTAGAARTSASTEQRARSSSSTTTRRSSIRSHPRSAPQMTLLRRRRPLLARARRPPSRDRRARLADAFGDEEPGSPLLPPRVIAASISGARTCSASSTRRSRARRSLPFCFFPKPRGGAPCARRRRRGSGATPRARARTSASRRARAARRRRARGRARCATRLCGGAPSTARARA